MRRRARVSAAAVVAGLVAALTALVPCPLYAQSPRDASRVAERRQADERLVAAALARGDTAAALEAQRRVVDGLTRGSAEWRHATALVIGLEAPTAAPERLRAALDTVRVAGAAGPALDSLAAGVARALLARDDTTTAAAVLQGIDGPLTTLERGYLLLADGDVATGREALLLSVDGLAPSEATDVIQGAELLGSLSPGRRGLMARAAVLAHGGRGVEAARLLEGGVDSLARTGPVVLEDSVARVDSVAKTDGPALLAEAARMAESAGADSLAARLRTRLLRQAPDAPEAGGATLALARYRARTPAGRQEAVRLLTGLVTRDPAAAVVPEARRELERLRGGGPR